MGMDFSAITKDPSLGAGPFTRLRPTTTLASEGVPSVSYASSTLVGIVVPAGPKESKLLPEDIRLDSVKVFHTSGDISAGDGGSQLPDVLQQGGESFQVLRVLDYRQVGSLTIGYLQAIAQKFTPGTLPVVPDDDEGQQG